MLLGGDGDISVTANVAPKLMSQMCAAALAGDAAKATELDSKLEALHRDLFVEANPIPVKWAVSELGLQDNVLRLPMTPLSAEHHELVRAAMRCAEII
jgi:4-hydroxy-tetrahydrodipicolinate synthase